MATSKSSGSSRSSSKTTDSTGADEQAIADAQEAEQAVVDQGHVTPDNPDGPEPAGDVKPTGELVTEDTEASMDQARRNANINPTSEDYNA